MAKDYTIEEKQKKILKEIRTFFDILDPSGENSRIYMERLGKLSPIEFDKWITDFFSKEQENFYLEIVEFERDLKIENLKKCAEEFNIPLFERVAVPYVTHDHDNPAVSPYPVAVGYVHIKRMQQTLLKKNSASIDISKRNPKTGQVVNEDKNARNSDVETFSLAAMNADYALRELMGPRADDMAAKNQMYNLISKNGFVSLEDLENDPINKVALNTLDVYFAIQGLRTNLVAPMDVLPEESKKIKKD